MRTMPCTIKLHPFWFHQKNEKETKRKEWNVYKKERKKKEESRTHIRAYRNRHIYAHIHSTYKHKHTIPIEIKAKLFFFIQYLYSCSYTFKYIPRPTQTYIHSVQHCTTLCLFYNIYEYICYMYAFVYKYIACNNGHCLVSGSSALNVKQINIAKRQ